MTDTRRQFPNDFGTERAFRPLDINVLARLGIFGANSGRWVPIAWTRVETKDEVASILVFGDGDAVELSYHVRGADVDHEEVRQTIGVTWTACNYGGRRPWFVCECGGRVGKLFGAERFLCRHCQGFSYASTRADQAERMLERAQTIRQRLGGSANMTTPFPPRPMGMHRATYERLRAESEQLGSEALRLGLQAALR